MMHHSAKDNYVHLTTTPVPRLITCGVLAEMKRKEAEQLQQRQS